MKTHADPSRRILTDRTLSAMLADHCPPTCRKCGQALKAGDYVDCFHPWDHAGNLCQRCEAKQPKNSP